MCMAGVEGPLSEQVSSSSPAAAAAAAAAGATLNVHDDDSFAGIPR